MERRKVKPEFRKRLDEVKKNRCEHLIAVIEETKLIENIGSIIRNVNAFGVSKVYVIGAGKLLPKDWALMRDGGAIHSVSVSAIKWTFVKQFDTTDECFDHLEKNGYVSLVTSPHIKGENNMIVHEADYTKYKKLAVWFGNESRGISNRAVERSSGCINIPLFGVIESLNLGTSSGVVLYEVVKQRREFQIRHYQKLQAKRRAGHVA
jgi:tRNA (guanosine-2'-O-)-methyltransferase